MSNFQKHKARWNDFGEDWLCLRCGEMGSNHPGELPKDSQCAIEETEEEFLSSYDLSKYPSVGLTVDLAVFTIRNGTLSILLVERGGHPFKNKWALPGGFANVDETLEESVARELREETSLRLDAKYVEQIKTYGTPQRDPRGYIASVAYVALVPNANSVAAGSDASDARFFSVDDALETDLAFDHSQILRDGLERVRAKLEYAPIAHHFLDDDMFTMSDLRRIYETVWGVELTPSNFRRKILSVPNLVVSTRTQVETDGPNAAELYQAGSASIISPPLTRPYV